MAIGYGVECPKPAPRIIERRQKKATDKRGLNWAMQETWTRAGSRCERCGRRVTKNFGNMDAGHCHHKVKRSQGGKHESDNLMLLCAVCHSQAHGGRT
jgi:5-methylcytosine-specific restriction endonuclease McrA